MSAEEPETVANDATEAGAAKDATEVIENNLSTRSRNVAQGSAEPLGEAWSDEADCGDDTEPERHPWSVVTGHAAALLSVGAAVAAVTVVVGVAILHKDREAASTAPATTARPAITTTQPGATTSIAPPPPSTYPANAIGAVILGPSEVAAVTGLTGPPLGISRPSDYPIWSTISPASCSNVMFNAEHFTDPSTGVVAEREGKFARSSTSEGNGPANVEESVLIFASVEEAKAAFNASQAQWRSCTSNPVTVGHGEDSWTYSLGDVRFHGDVSSVSMASASQAKVVGDRACQTAIGSRANVVVETWTCLWASFPYFPATPADPNAAGDYAVQLVATMLDKVKV